MSEYDLIRQFSQAFRQCPLQQNNVFECDSELIRIGDQLWALTMDEFTPEEDLFTSEDPEVLGANLAVATLSDLLAAGASPAWFMHAISLPKAADLAFISGLSLGINEVLSEAGCSLCGGDIGCADTWRFCGFAMGPVQGNRPLTRIMPCEPQTLWVTGTLGDANLAALSGLPTPRFELRLTEAEFIKRSATACIDTSGGLFDALWMLHTLNPGLQLEVDIDKLPIASGVREAAQAAGFPAEAALLGGAGEYELLFTMPASFDDQGIGALRIGAVQPGSEPGLYIYRSSNLINKMTEPPPCPRDAATVQDHIQDVMAMARRLFGLMATSDALFSELRLRNMTLPNRIIRSATYEGWGEADGTPRSELADVYSELARGGVGTIITGFVFISQEGRAMHPGQCGIDSDEKIAPWRRIVESVRKTNPEVKLIMQIAHTGRQTRRQITGVPLVGASDRPCTYFRQRPHALDDSSIADIIREFAYAAYRAKKAGFDAVQIHAAHGYLIHQFLSPWTNTRTDRWADCPLLLEEVIQAVRSKCGYDFPVLVKLSAADDNSPGIRVEDTIETVKRLERLEIDAVEISYGTMEYALNIIRGAVPIDAVLRVNPMFNRIPGLFKSLWKKFCAPAYLRQFIPFEQDYNLEAASRIWSETELPIIAVGGIRTLESMVGIISDFNIDAVALCRLLICEPDIPRKILSGEFTKSKCTNCNLCAIYCDSRQPLRCYRKKGIAQ